MTNRYSTSSPRELCKLALITSRHEYPRRRRAAGASGWLLDKSAAARADEPSTRRHLEELAGLLYLCPVGELEQLHSSRSARAYDELKVAIHQSFDVVGPPVDIFDRALRLQRDLAHHHGMWHRTPIPHLLIAETALHYGLGVVHVDRDYERIAEVRPLKVRRVQ